MRQRDDRQVTDSHTGCSALYVVKVTVDVVADTQTPHTHRQLQSQPPSEHVTLTVTLMTKFISVTADDGMSGLALAGSVNVHMADDLLSHM